jgi:hypothetical protein
MAAMGRTISPRRLAQPSLPNVKGTLGDSTFQAVGGDSEATVCLPANDLTPFFGTRKL